MGHEDDKQGKLETIVAQRIGLYASADSWALEALKHVALVGSGGIAATFALRAAAEQAGIDKAATVGPAFAFAAGIVLATLAMAAGYKQRTMTMEIYLEAEGLVQDDHADATTYLSLHQKVSVLAPLVDILGWSGFAADILGGLLLFKAL